MAKFYGEVGYKTLVEKETSVWVEDITERMYDGDFYKVSKRTSNSSVNGDTTMISQISIVSDGFAVDNFLNIVYVKYMGAKWAVTTVDVQRPRLILTLGGIYNGE